MGKKSQKQRFGQGIEGRLSREDQYALTIFMHFPHNEPGDEDSLRCQDCLDYRQGVCRGDNLTGEDVLLCMMEHAFDGSWGIIH